MQQETGELKGQGQNILRICLQQPNFLPLGPISQQYQRRVTEGLWWTQPKCPCAAASESTEVKRLVWIIPHTDQCDVFPFLTAVSIAQGAFDSWSILNDKNMIFIKLEMLSTENVVPDSFFPDCLSQENNGYLDDTESRFPQKQW